MEKPRIIVVDDSKLMRVSLKNCLKDEFDIVETENGEQGWKTLTSDPTLQVVITDAQMPVLDGWELIARIRGSSLDHVREIPVIMITGADDETARERALAAGATDFVTKPFDKTQLLARTRTHAKLDQTTRKLAAEGAIDPVTNVNSRRYFSERGTQDLAFAKRRSQDVSVIVMRIDRYDAIRADHGEEVGTELLQWVARKIKETVRTEDTLARIEGASFAVIASGAGRLEGAVLCERARKAVIAAPFAHGGGNIPVSLSLGLVCFGHDRPETIEKFLEIAEQRATRAQAEGGNRIVAADVAEKKPDSVVVELVPGVDSALQMIASKNVERLKPHFVTLLRRVLPLFEAADAHLKLGIGDALAAIRQKLAKP
jgi:diguanylate cyclase (GGDEF)-like protein